MSVAGGSECDQCMCCAYMCNCVRGNTYSGVFVVKGVRLDIWVYTIHPPQYKRMLESEKRSQSLQLALVGQVLACNWQKGWVLILLQVLNLPPPPFSSVFKDFGSKSKIWSGKIWVEVENFSGLRAMCFPHSGRRGEEEAVSRRKWTSNRLVQVDFQLFPCFNLCGNMRSCLKGFLFSEDELH